MAPPVTLTPREVEKAMPFLEKIMKRRRAPQKDAFEKGTFSDLAALFKMLMLVLTQKVSGLTVGEKELLLKKRTTLLPLVKSASLVRRTLRSKDRITTVLRPLLRTLPSIVRLFVKHE